MTARKNIAVAVVGLGWMGQAHSRSLIRIPTLFSDRNFNPILRVCADFDLNRGNQAVEDFGFERSTQNWQDAVEANDVDAVWVCAPNMLHLPIIEAASKAGKIVFSEKPIGGKPEQTVEAFKIAAKNKTFTGVGYNYLWAPLVLHAKKMISEGELGEIIHFKGRFFSMYGSDELGLLSWRFKFDQAGYGVSSDILSHSISLAQFLIGEITEAVGMKETTIKKRPLPSNNSSHYSRGKIGDPLGEVENEDFASMLCRFKNGATGTFETSRTVVGPESENLFEIYGTKGALKWNHESLNELLYYKKDNILETGYTKILGGDRFDFHGAFVPGQGNSLGTEDLICIEDYSFLTAWVKGQEFKPSFSEAVDVVSVQAALIKSWESRKWETVKRLS
jgi:predicted dehydrogenase